MERIEILHSELASLEMDVKDLSWTGPEPTRLTYNRLVENGDEEDPQARWSGQGPHSTLARWGESKGGGGFVVVLFFCCRFLFH